MRRPYRSARIPKITAPTGRNSSVAVNVLTIWRFGTPNCAANTSSRNTTTKKSNASRVQPRNPARTACREDDFMSGRLYNRLFSMSSVSLQGNLDVFKLPDVLNFLHSALKTGMLTLTLAEKEAYVFFRAGEVVYAASNHESLRLGPIMVRKKKLSRDQAGEIDDLMLRSGGRFGDIALQKGVLNQAQLDDFMKVQASEVIYDAFVWKTGGFAFFDDIDLPPQAVTISIDLSNLIMEGARRIGEWEECLRLLPDSSVVFCVATD